MGLLFLIEVKEADWVMFILFYYIRPLTHLSSTTTFFDSGSDYDRPKFQNSECGPDYENPNFNTPTPTSVLIKPAAEYPWLVVS